MGQSYSIVICINRRLGINAPSCATRGAEALADQIETQLNKASLPITLQRIECLGQCERGPNLRIAPGGRFFHEMKIEDIPDVIRELQHLLDHP